jgi:hypothetical protein
MTLNNWTIKYYPEWDKYFKKFDSNTHVEKIIVSE